MAVWELIRDAMQAAHGRGQEWLTVGEITKEVQSTDQAVKTATIHGTVRYHCINDPSKRYAPQYKTNPLFVTDDPTMHGKRFRLLTEHERSAFLSNPRDDLEFVSYTQLMEWLADPAKPLDSETDEEEEELAPEVSGAALLEIHLQDYIFRNWQAVFPHLQLYQGPEGREYRTQDPGVGILDFLCTDKQGNFVVIETKRALPDRQAVGQVLGYVGWVKQKLCNEGQTVRGILVANEITDQLRLAAAAVPNLDLYLYEISFDIRPATA